MNTIIEKLLNEAKEYVGNLELKNKKGLIGDDEIERFNDLAKAFYLTDKSIKDSEGS